MSTTEIAMKTRGLKQFRIVVEGPEPGDDIELYRYFSSWDAAKRVFVDALIIEEVAR